MENANVANSQIKNHFYATSNDMSNATRNKK